MAEEEPEAVETEEGGGGNRKLILMIVGAVVLLLGLGAGAWWFMSGSGDDEDGGGQQMSQSQKPPTAPSEGVDPKQMVSLESFVVNLSRSERSHYLKVTLKLQMTNSKYAQNAGKYKPKIRDALIILLSNQSVEDLRSMEGKYQLKRQIVSRVNNAMGQEMVSDVFFSDFVIQ